MWLNEFRARFGIELDQLGAQIRRIGARMDPPLRVSDELLYRLETIKGFKTVPKLADLIAEACGATALQRDELVLEQFRGTWKPRGRRKVAVVAPAPQPKPKPPAPVAPRTGRAIPDARTVVKVDRTGRELARYRSCNYAAVQNCVTENQVTRRCHRAYSTDEFKHMGYTFRFAAEWDRMGPEQRRADVCRLNGVVGRRGGTASARMVTVVDRGGNIFHYDSVDMAATATGIPFHMMEKRLRIIEQERRPAAMLYGFKFTYTTLWDCLDRQQREQVRRMREDGVRG